MQDFKKLKVWERAHELTLNVYKLTKKFPKDEIFNLVSQMRRSSSSIATNIAEGCGQGSDAGFKRYLQISIGSTLELEYQLLLSRDLNYIIDTDFKNFTGEIDILRKMLISFQKKLTN